MQKIKRTGILCIGIVIQLIVWTSPIQAEEPSINTKGFSSHWLVEKIKEPVFNSKICVIETGDKSNETIVLIHGLGEAGLLDWVEEIPLLEENYHVLALDLPGFGRSETPEGDLTPTNYAKVIKWLVQRTGKKQVIVAGHSLGGAIALRFAATNPQYVKKLILVDAAGVLEKTAFVKHLAQKKRTDKDSINTSFFRSQMNKLIGGIIEDSSDSSTSSKEMTRIINRTFKDTTTIKVAWALIDEDFTEAIKKTSVNTSIIWGGQDKLAPLRIGKILGSRMRNASLNVIKGGSHSPMNSHTKEFNILFLASLKNQEPNIKPTANKKSQGDLICKKEWNKTHTGTYDTITVKNCVNLHLKNIRAKQIIIENSDVEIDGLVIVSTETALDLKNAIVRITVGDISGKTGIKADHSRLDLGGIDIIGTESGMIILDETYTIFSVSTLSAPLYKGNVHGVYKGKNTSLEEMILNTPDN